MTGIILVLQGSPPEGHPNGYPYVVGGTTIVACAKHFVGDGESYSQGVDTRRMSSNTNINVVFYATFCHPIQAGNIDGSDITPHDNGVYHAVLCATTGLYDPSSDP
jgi:hypothetical protein